MPCKDTTSQISIVLDQNDKLLDFEYSKMTCNKEIGGNTGFREYCLGKSIETLSKLEFSDLVAFVVLVVGISIGDNSLIRHPIGSENSYR